jgi:hypothetical protein
MKIPFKLLYPLADMMSKATMDKTALRMIVASKASVDHTLYSLFSSQLLVVINAPGQ